MEPINPEQLGNAETRKSVETQKEQTDANLIQGAQMLEEPTSGSFVTALQVFVAWVKRMVD